MYIHCMYILFTIHNYCLHKVCQKLYSVNSSLLFLHNINKITRLIILTCVQCVLVQKPAQTMAELMVQYVVSQESISIYDINKIVLLKVLTLCIICFAILNLQITVYFDFVIPIQENLLISIFILSYSTYSSFPLGPEAMGLFWIRICSFESPIVLLL